MATSSFSEKQWNVTMGLAAALANPTHTFSPWVLSLTFVKEQNKGLWLFIVPFAFSFMLSLDSVGWDFYGKSCCFSACWAYWLVVFAPQAAHLCIISSQKHTIVLWWPSAVTLFLWLCSSKCQFLLHCSLCEARLPVRVKLQRRSVWGALDTTATFSVMRIL